MEREYGYLLELLGDYLHEREAKADPQVNWHDLIRLSQIHCVTGVLGYMSMQYPICPDEKLRASLRQACLNTIALFAQRAGRMEELIGHMNRAQIHHILMKGYVIRNYYPVPELRTFGDIDFVIRPEDRQKSHDMMLEMGFQVETDWEPVFSYSRGNEYYEIHRDIMEVDVSEKADYKSYFQQMWKYAQPQKGCTYHFSPEFHFLYLLTHIAKHIRGAGAGARMYLDIAAFVKHFGADVDWEFVMGELKSLELYDFACVVLTAVEEWFEVVNPVEHRHIDESVMEEFRVFTMEAGVFGHFQRETGVSALKRENEKSSRVGLLLKRVFPKAKEIESRYTYLQDKPWLLPAAWVHRLVKTRGSLGTHAHEAKVILSADEQEVQRLQRITREIGL